MHEKTDISSHLKSKQKEEGLTDEITQDSLEISAIRLELKKLELEYERHHLSRLIKNNERRPFLFRLVMGVIAFLYAGLIASLARVIYLAYVTMPGTHLNESQTFIVSLIIMATIPTALLIVLLRALFSPRLKAKQLEEETKTSDVIPVKNIVSSLKEL